MSEMYEQAAQNGFWLVEDETIASKRMMLEAQIEVKMNFVFKNCAFVIIRLISDARGGTRNYE